MPARLTSVKYSSLRWEEVSNFKTLLREVVVKPFNKFLVSAALLVLPTLAMAQGKIAVVNLEEAILQTDLAQQRLAEFEKNEDFTSDKNEFESLREELDKLVQDFQRDQAAMSEIRWLLLDKRSPAKTLILNMSPRNCKRYSSKMLSACCSSLPQRLAKFFVTLLRQNKLAYCCSSKG